MGTESLPPHLPTASSTYSAGIDSHHLQEASRIWTYMHGLGLAALEERQLQPLQRHLIPLVIRLAWGRSWLHSSSEMRLAYDPTCQCEPGTC